MHVMGAAVDFFPDTTATPYCTLFRRVEYQFIPCLAVCRVDHGSSSGSFSPHHHRSVLNLVAANGV